MKVLKLSNQYKKLNINIFFRYLHFLFKAKNTKGHGIHSPFVFQYVQDVIYETHPFYIFRTIEHQRNILLSDNTEINITDFGAGTETTRKISDIARRSLKRKKFAQLLYRTAVYFKSENILELGTSLGITTSYLAASSESAVVITLEGCPRTTKVAKNIFDNLGFKNIEIVGGNIDQTLDNILNKLQTLDLAFIDANHRYEPLMDYFVKCISKVHSNTVFFIDDIYWSDGMKKAWEQIKKNEKVTSTIDIFEMGIVFFNPDLSKKHYKLLF